MTKHNLLQCKSEVPLLERLLLDSCTFSSVIEIPVLFYELKTICSNNVGWVIISVGPHHQSCLSYSIDTV